MSESATASVKPLKTGKAAAIGNCFGCSQQNSKGLQMVFQGHGDQPLLSTVHLGHEYESFPGIVHGGIVATVIDEAMGRSALERTRIPSVTIGMRVRYAQVMRSHATYHVTSRTTQVKDDVVYTEAELHDEAGTLTATGSGTFLLLTTERMESLKSSLPEDMLHSIRELEAWKKTNP